MILVRLADLRDSRNWTQKYVASYLCVAQRSYGHYENGTRSLPLEHLIKLTELYGVSSDYILGITDRKKAVFQTQEKEVLCCKDIIKYSMIGLLSTLYRTAERGCATCPMY